MNAVQHPTHYNAHPSGVECITVAQWLPFNIGNAYKYIFRRNHKGAAAQDLEKAVQYLQFEMIRAPGVMAPVPTHIHTAAMLVAKHEPDDLAMAMVLLLNYCDSGSTGILLEAIGHVRAAIARGAASDAG